MKFGVNSSNAPRTSCLGMMCLSGEVSGRADPGDRECGRRAAGARAEQECDQGHHVRQGEEQLVRDVGGRSEEHTSELQSLMRISYAVFCLKKKKQQENAKNDKKVSNDITH